MTVHATLTSDEMLPAEIRKALSLTQPAAVYSGRFPRPLSQPVEVFLERQPESAATFGRVVERPYRAIIFVGTRTGGADQTGRGALDEAEALMVALVDHFDGAIPAEFKTRLPALFAIRAREELTDNEPENGAEVAVSAILSFYLQG